MKPFLSIPATLSLLLLGQGALAGSVTEQAMDQEVATTRALGKVPEGKTVTGTSCQSIERAFETAYRCTVTWD